VNVTSNQITSTLSLLSSSLINGQPLPPHLELPQPFGFVKKLENIDHNILSVRHIEEPEYSAFAVIQICGGCIVHDIEKLAEYVSCFPFFAALLCFETPLTLTSCRNVKSLVGEIDFSYRPINTSSSSSGRSSEDESRGKSE
jgi:hypothetical protein